MIPVSGKHDKMQKKTIRAFVAITKTDYKSISEIKI